MSSCSTTNSSFVLWPINLCHSLWCSGAALPVLSIIPATSTGFAMDLMVPFLPSYGSKQPERKTRLLCAYSKRLSNSIPATTDFHRKRMPF
mmetsp:Transcript_6653/g.10470  ORF Transcript_6653/g.10470 Transcript_6653/m.10470 type:complete len:91 (+) Transcript_6653:839-1111(+)